MFMVFFSPSLSKRQFPADIILVCRCIFYVPSSIFASLQLYNTRTHMYKRVTWLNRVLRVYMQIMQLMLIVMVTNSIFGWEEVCDVAIKMFTFKMVAFGNTKKMGVNVNHGVYIYTDFQICFMLCCWTFSNYFSSILLILRDNFLELIGHLALLLSQVIYLIENLILIL